MAFTFPSSPETNDTFTVGSRTYTWTGTKWVLSGGVITSTQIEANAITTVKILDGAITAAKIADGTIVAAEIASNAVTTAKILDANVTADKLSSNAVTTAKILDAAVTQAKLGTTLSAVTVTTAANRDTAVTSPFTGQLVFLTDTKKIQVWDGTSWITITIAPPEAPTSLSAVASTTSVAISFTLGANNGSAITNHKYALSTDGGSTYGSFIALDPVDVVSPITVSGLSMNTEYYVKLKAVNDVGDSVASNAVTFTTEGVPAAPTSLSASSITGSTADIAFTAGAANGASITNYKFAVSTDDITYGAFSALSPTDASTPITVTGLTSGTLQYVKLKAVNSNGDSAASAAVSFTTLNTPSAPTSLSAAPSTLSVDISFTPGAQGGSAISNYQYAISTNGGSTYGSFTALSPTDATSPITITGLTADTSYYVKLKAVNSAGAGTESSAVSFTTLNTLTVSYLVVAGGGTGGSYGCGLWDGGGGGAGGLRGSFDVTGGGGALESPLAVTRQTNFSAVVGGGGGNSTFSTVTSNAGGSGGNSGNGGGGGCGGAGSFGTPQGSGGSGTAGQGFAGGFGAGAGGGSGSAGGNNSGGAGVTSSITGTATTYAPGSYGNGGAGGSGGACSGGSNPGSAGVVILRYPSGFTITLGAGLTGTTATVSTDKVTTITAGSGNVSWT
jgi:hypothetical protein